MNAKWQGVYPKLMMMVQLIVYAKILDYASLHEILDNFSPGINERRGGKTKKKYDTLESHSTGRTLSCNI